VWRLAQRYAARGVPVFPCVPNGKRPLTKHGLHDASTDRDVISSWSRTYPDANLAIATGRWSRLFVLDVDRKPDGPDGIDTLEELEETLGTLTTTLTAFTPSGGEHRYFRMPWLPLRNSAAKLGGGLDTRGEGGYVLVSPSVIDGRGYQWAVRTAPVELPAQWLEALAPQHAPSKQERWVPSDDSDRSRAAAWCLRALQDEAHELAASPPGTRNDRLWRAAAALGGLVHVGAFDAEQVRRALTWACSTWSTRSPAKDARTLEGGLEFGLAHPRQVNIERAV
jgi:putative DNA primase/helicase